MITAEYIDRRNYELLKLIMIHSYNE